MPPVPSQSPPWYPATIADRTGVRPPVFTTSAWSLRSSLAPVVTLSTLTTSVRRPPPAPTVATTLFERFSAPTVTVPGTVGAIVRTAAAPLALIVGTSAPGSAVIVAGPVTVSVLVAASHVAALPAATHAGNGVAGWVANCDSS